MESGRVGGRGAGELELEGQRPRHELFIFVRGKRAKYTKTIG